MQSVLPIPAYDQVDKLHRMIAETTDAARREILARFLPAFQKTYEARLAAPRPDFTARLPQHDHILLPLQRDGVVLLTLDPADKEAIKRLTAPTVSAIEAHLHHASKKFNDVNRVLPRAENGALYEAVESALRRSGIFAAGAIYAGRPLRVKQLAAQVNSERETATRYGPIGSDGLPANKLAYLHLDSTNWPPIKLLFYLNEVTPDQGPFRYCTGSHRWAGDFETVVRKTNDRLKLEPAQFLALPEELRMHTLLGDHLNAPSPDAERLIATELVCCGAGKDIVVFDNNGVHRGGFVRHGVRHVLQCTFEAAK